MTNISTPTWPWYIAGPLIGLFVPVLLLFDNKHLGISSTLKDFCSLVAPRKIHFFNYSFKDYLWRNLFVIGVFGGGLLAYLFWGPGQAHISIETVTQLQQNGIHDFSGLVPTEIFSWAGLLTLKGFIFIVVGGFLVGFGTRWANGCTSGHTIMGLSLLSPASFAATTGFFLGGLVSTHFLIPLIL